MYLAMCLAARYMEISMYLTICLAARYMEISMNLAMCLAARNMEMSMYLAICLKALANEDTLLPTHCCRHKCFPVCPSATFVADTNFVSRDPFLESPGNFSGP